MNEDLEDDDVELFVFLAFFSSIPRNQPTLRTRINYMHVGDDLFKTHFRFKKQDIDRLFIALDFPIELRVNERLFIDGKIALLMLLMRLSYPNRLVFVSQSFGYSISACSQFINASISRIMSKWGRLLQWHDTRLTANRLTLFASRIAAKTQARPCCVAFIDGTLRPICRPTEDQADNYSGHRKMHAIKFQGMMCPDGIFYHMAGPYPAPWHDARVLRNSGLMTHLQRNLMINNVQHFAYADGAYPLMSCLMAPFKGDHLTERQQQFNNAMGDARRSVEHGFAHVIRQFAFLDYKKNLKKGLQRVHLYYQVGTILANCFTCLYGNQIADYFNMRPPELEEYLCLQEA